MAQAARTLGKPARRGPGRPTLSNEELLDTALDLFLEHGFERTSIEGICAAAGMAKRTVYARYGDKTTLFKAALDRAIGEWIVPVEQLAAAETDDLGESLLAIGRLLLANILSPAGQRLMRLTNAESIRMPEIGPKNVHQGTEPTIAWLAQLFDRRLGGGGAGAGGGGGGGFADARQAAESFLYLVVGGPANMAAWGVGFDPGEIDRHVNYSVGLFLNGVLASAPHGRADATRALIGEALAQLDTARATLARAAGEPTGG